MLTLEKLNELRGIKPSTPTSKTVEDTSNIPLQGTISPTSSSASSQIDRMSTQSSPSPQKGEPVQPVEIPCKHYADEAGHFAYIDADTKQIMHVNLENGKVYTQDEVNRMSIQHAVEPLSEDYKVLTWQQVMNRDTLFDQFGSPVFSFDDIQKAFDNLKQQNTNQEASAVSASETNEKNAPKVDPWGIPISG